jgi:hypothetical protein
MDFGNGDSAAEGCRSPGSTIGGGLMLIAHSRSPSDSYTIGDRKARQCHQSVQEKVVGSLSYDFDALSTLGCPIGIIIYRNSLGGGRACDKQLRQGIVNLQCQGVRCATIEGLGAGSDSRAVPYGILRDMTGEDGHAEIKRNIQRDQNQRRHERYFDDTLSFLAKKLHIRLKTTASTLMFPAHGCLSHNDLGVQIVGYTDHVQQPVEKKVVVSRYSNPNHLIAAPGTRNQFCIYSRV